MSRMNKGFIMLDSLLSVFIVTYICLMCFSIYKTIEQYEKSYINYQFNSNDSYEEIFNTLIVCEACEVDESD